MDNNIFSGLENLGFNKVESVELYPSQKEEKSKKEVKPEETSFLYDRELTCPVCNSLIKVHTIKTGVNKIVKKHSDFYAEYSNVNPYFYDIIVCNNCGYSASKIDFSKIKKSEIDLVKSKISPKWVGKHYGKTYNVDVAIERFKLALLNYCVMESKSSKKAMICLKIAWMYRIKHDNDSETLFLKESLSGLEDAYMNENFPIYGMDKYTLMYLIGELYKRTGNPDNALRWFSMVITTPNINPRVKDLARTQKDEIMAEEKKSEEETGNISTDEDSEDEDSEKKHGLFSKLFKK